MISNLAGGVQAFTSNTFLVGGDRTVLVDTGANFDVVSVLEDRVSELDAVMLTHTHPDHIGNLSAVREAFDAPVWGFDPEFQGVDHQLAAESTHRLGDHDYRVLHTPGHKDDHVCLYAPEPGVLFAGDLVFANGGFGRTDLEEGDRETLIDSLELVLDVVAEPLCELHAGHGPSVTNSPYEHIELAARMARQ